MPTKDSMNKVLQKITKMSGQNGKILGAYVKNDNFKAMNKYASDRERQNSNPNRKEYSPFSNNCGTFAKDTVEAGGVDTPLMLDPRPNSYVEEMRDDFTDVNYSSQEGTSYGK